MPAPRVVGVLWGGQSNQQGATLTDNGGSGALFTSAYTGETEPFRLNANGGGSCLPRLVDLGLARGVKFMFFNGGIGGASATHFSGVVGASVVGGSAATPAAACNMSGVGLSAGTGVAAVEGGPQFDPFGLLARMRAIKLQWPQITEWVGTWANAESDGLTSASLYQGSIETIGNYLLASGCNKFLCGLSSAGQADSTGMNKLQTAYRAALTKMASEGKQVARGGDLYDVFGLFPPLYDERFAPGTRVHLTLEGQRKQAEAWNAALLAAGY